MRPISFDAQFRLYVAFVLLIILAESLLAWLWTPEWVSLTSGFFGSIALAVPPARIELLKQSATRLEQLDLSADLAELRDDAIGPEIERSISRWDPMDSLFIFLGAALLAASFFIAIVDKAMR